MSHVCLRQYILRTCQHVILLTACLLFAWTVLHHPLPRLLLCRPTRLEGGDIPQGPRRWQGP